MGLHRIVEGDLKSFRMFDCCELFKLLCSDDRHYDVITHSIVMKRESDVVSAFQIDFQAGQRCSTRTASCEHFRLLYSDGRHCVVISHFIVL